ncbi:AcrR family transcriptional regulator [Paenalcaligenes hominis]|uniref:AcrR family transcriptional regulator n=1 Tax=Paenalcaligenes hominis TaxID=643674 RepID=A0ABX0WQ48_9BURK|nr:TetR/AcrR family transcriptional regulator [Paenalcaligenes hominis]NJB64172.1 AcrR family transcriptional regulator [Paenalcaligenes hominis]GGE75477.1 TetR family transcriptional regulator [Paenalcaligenes hominis]
MTLSRREKTEQRIMQALEDQIRATGMVGVGINAIAERAGVSKELIYRYFDGLPGLMMQWMKNQDFWTSNSSTLRDPSAETNTPKELILKMLRAQISALQDNDALKEIRRWELIERNEVSGQLAERREMAARPFIDELAALNDEMDVPAMVSVMLAGVLYLSLRAKTESQFLGVPLRTSEGWKRIDNALIQLTQSLPAEFQNTTLKELRAHHPQTETNVKNPSGSDSLPKHNEASE